MKRTYTIMLGAGIMSIFAIVIAYAALSTSLTVTSNKVTRWNISFSLYDVFEVNLFSSFINHTRLYSTPFPSIVIILEIPFSFSRFLSIQASKDSLFFLLYTSIN